MKFTQHGIGNVKKLLKSIEKDIVIIYSNHYHGTKGISKPGSLCLKV